MSAIKELEQTLCEQIIPEIEESIDEVFIKIAEGKSASKEDKEHLQEAQSLKKDFEQMLEELQAGEIDEDEAQELLDEINEL